ncbi:MAG: Flp pilus assembly protein TadD, contains TPR repeat [uncultured Sphingomonas sp.]|uniref:Flp pilus assembly protein TadD, contains TPR repeat n=1 Tax=uncultured Sphingomonas sp. TaxID=158754 RepID=A0A6J4SI10_9SPHN|nr:MAG: Flp pilus assembly protein TadD, contains TPR repeat [uncultured Sphingomonas sp.]
MPKSFRFATAVALGAMSTAIAGCATSQKQSVTTSGFGGQANGEVGLATRALAALNANDFATAIGFAERAVARTPDDAGFRSILGDSYFGAGRFASAESAYKDALAIYSNQPQAVLKLALAEIAQGKNGEALAFLEAGRNVLDPANYGLAVALAGRPVEAVAVLEAAARQPGADARVRQNLALALALTGDWSKARLVAEQDVPAGQLNERLHQWMQLAKPARASDQVASLTGVTPAAKDPGQPIRLALVKPGTRQAEAAPVPQPQVAYAATAPAPEPPQVAYVPEMAPEPQVAELAPPPFNPDRVSAAAVGQITVKLPRAREVGEAPPAFTADYVQPKPRLRRGAAPTQRAVARPAAVRHGNSSAVVQLGAYGSPQRVLAAWNAAARRHSALRAYKPTSARFVSARGPVYRLAVKGFASSGEAVSLCASLRRAGGSCFVRNVAGDSPVQLASR